MIRHHANILLTNYWRTLVAPSAAVFRALFLNAGVSDAVLDAWHSQLVKGGDVKHVQWVASYRRDLARMPQVVIQSGDTNDLEEIMGHGGDPDPLLGTVKVIARREVLFLTCYAENQQLVDAMHRATLSMLLLSTSAIMRSEQYAGITYEGADPVEPDEELFPETTGIFVRRQRWSVDGILCAATGTPETMYTQIALAAFDATDAFGDPGEVTPEDL